MATLEGGELCELGSVSRDFRSGETCQRDFMGSFRKVLVKCEVHPRALMGLMVVWIRRRGCLVSGGAMARYLGMKWPVHKSMDMI